MTDETNGVAVDSGPTYGSRLLTEVVDHLAKSEPDRLYAIYPRNKDVSNGFHKITFRTLSRAINQFAITLESLIGRSKTFETIAYQGPSDIRYIVVWLGAIKCGYKLLVPSPRNAAWMNVSLLQSTSCTKFLTADQTFEMVRRVQQDMPELQIFKLKSLDGMLGPDDGREVQSYEHYTAEYTDVKFDPVLVLHSSGSTGPPKPVVTNHASWAVADHDRDMPKVPGRQNQNWSLFDFSPDPLRDIDGTFFAAFPPFHLGGIMCLILPIYSTNATLVMAHPDTLPTGHTVSKIMKQMSLRAIFAPPTILEQLCQEPEGIKQAGNLDFVLYAGGPLTQRTGDALNQATKVCQFFGMTETNGIQALVPQREDWAYFEFHPSAGIEMRPSEDEAYELVLTRGSESRESRVFSCNFPDVLEYRTRDLFRPHPSKKGLWKFHGRRDDIIVLSNGEKFNPIPGENIIGSHPLINAALIVGTGRFQPVLLVEPKQEAGTDTNAIIRAIWPTVEEANSKAPGQGRISPSMILIVPASRPFERAGKGTVIRKMTADKFETEISALYPDVDTMSSPTATEMTLTNGDKANGSTNGHTRPRSNNFRLSGIQSFVSSLIRGALKYDIRDSDDVYVCGLDSLRTIEIVDALKRALSLTEEAWLQPQTLYNHPTINELSKYIHQRLQAGAKTNIDNDCNGSQPPQSSIDDLVAMLAKHTSSLKPNLHVLLTGATGSLGVQILMQLLECPSIAKVTCMTRSSSSKIKQKLIYLASLYGRPSAADVVAADYASPLLGMSQEEYHSICGKVDVIVHNAWPVNFTWTLRSFEPQIVGVRNVIEMARASTKNARLIFISSASSVSSLPCPNDQPKNAIPETIITELNAPASMGYSQSKFVAESLLNSASTQLNIPSTILRVGQIAGHSSTDAKSRTLWKKDEWVHALLRTSKTLKALPFDLPDVDWLPIDVVAAVVKDVVVSSDTSNSMAGASVFNVINPNRVRWIHLLPGILHRLGSDARLVTLEEWVELLSRLQREDAQSFKEEADLPALRLIEFFKMLQSDPSRPSGGEKYATKKARAASAALRDAEGIKAEWLDRWMDEWGL